MKKIIILLIILTGLGGLGKLSAQKAPTYAESSVLADGRWARIRVSERGMTLVSDALLRQLGFSNPEKVKVYGLGGAMLPTGLSANNTDDLPLLPSVRTSKGLLFYAIDTYKWSNSYGNTPYTHIVNYYSDDCYYFLSDKDVSAPDLPDGTAVKADPTGATTTFVEHLLHEQDLMHPGESGAFWFGEDFRSKKNQAFPFTLTDAADDLATINVRFAAKANSSSVILSANGNRLPSYPYDVIGPPNSNHGMFRTKKYTRSVEGLKGSLSVGLDFSYSGTLFLARLDYIEVFYNRQLRMRDNELLFQGQFSSGERLAIEGCSAATQIWDVTNPANPKKIVFALNGSTACFKLMAPGYYEFVAFNPDNISRAASAAGNVGSIAAQNIHAMPVPDMVILTMPEYMQAARQLADFHTSHDGMLVHVLTPEPIYNEFSGGSRDVTAFRRMLKMWYERGQQDGHSLQYCILFGKPTYDNRQISLTPSNSGYNPMPIYQSPEEDKEDITELNSYSSDNYIGMMANTANGSEFSFDLAKIHVKVGRIPCTSLSEATAYVEKVKKYVTSPEYGSWRSRLQIISDDDDNNAHFKQSQKTYDFLRSAGNGASFVYDRVYLDSYRRVQTGVGDTYPQATARMLKNYNDGVIFTNYIGHASENNWGHEHLYTWEDITSMSNRNLSFIYGSTCRFGYWDSPSTISGAEVLVLNPNAGAIAILCASRTVFVDPNGKLNNAFAANLFRRGEDGRALTFGEVFRLANNAEPNPNNLRYAYYGDPAIRVPSPDYEIKINKINGVDISERSAFIEEADTLPDGTYPDLPHYPEVSAMSSVTVEGEILNLTDGKPADGFDGTLNLQLFDAEKIITTYGQGTQGVSVSYNDRTTRLSTANAAVKDGKFEATLRVPPEISDNYSPALIAAYAFDGKGREANGATERLYVYGASAESPDTKGPAIEKLFVNHEGNASGALVAPNSILFAHLRDESGINVSEGGIGHSLTLTVDGKQIYSDLNSYYVQDSSDPDFGVLKYPLSGLSGGKHSLLLSVWDNANNNSKASLEINVGTAVDPAILDITTDVNPASESVNFLLTLDRPNTRLACTIGVYSLDGRKLWEQTQSPVTDSDSRLSMRWNLCDGSGTRVPRGIYVYRATVTTEEGTYSSKSKRLAVTAP